MLTLSRRISSSCESFAPISGWQLAKKLEMISIWCCLFLAANLQIFWKRNWYGFDLDLRSYPPPEVTKMDCCWFTVLGFSSYMSVEDLGNFASPSFCKISVFHLHEKFFCLLLNVQCACNSILLILQLLSIQPNPVHHNKTFDMSDYLESSDDQDCPRSPRLAKACAVLDLLS